MITKINSISFTRNNQSIQSNSIKHSFGSAEVANTPYEIKPNEIRIPNLLDLQDGVLELRKDDYPEKINQKPKFKH